MRRRKVAANCRDLLQQRRICSSGRKVGQSDTDFDRNRIDSKQRIEIFFRGSAACAGAAVATVSSLRFLAHAPGCRADSAAEREKRNRRQAREQRERDQYSAGKSERLRIAE